MRHVQHGVHNLLGRLRPYGTAAFRAVRHTDAGVEQTQIVVNFGDGAHGGARVVADAFLVNGNGRAEALNLVYVWLFHLPQKLAGVGRKRFDVAALPLGKNRIEG